MSDAEMLGTGKMNRVGGSGTVTIPKDALDKYEVGDESEGVAWFEDGDKLYLVPKTRVTME